MADNTQRPTNPEYPVDGQIAKQGKRELVATGYAAIYETFKFAAKHAPARATYSLVVMNKKGGFDCPSCAWPDPDGLRSPAEFCENGAKAVAWETSSKRVTPDFFAKYSLTELAAKNEQWLGDQGRITHPMVLREGSNHYEPIEWSDAFELIAQHLNGLKSPNEAVLYTSGRASNEAAFVYGLFARQFGTNNLPDCSNMCHESTSVGLAEQTGLGKASIRIDDFEHCDAIFMFGMNPGTNFPRMLTSLEAAVKNGAKIVAINPLHETGMRRFKHPQHVTDMLSRGTQIATLNIPIRINSDVALLKGIMKEMLDADDHRVGEVFDHKFINEYTSGYEEFIADLRVTSWDDILQATGVSREIIREAAEIAIKSERMISTWCMGLTQHHNGVSNVQTLANFTLLRGNIGRKGAGLCPVRGHSNVQGDRTMGIWEKMPEKFLASLGKEFNFEPPREHGVDAVKAVEAIHKGEIKVFVGLGGNFINAVPDTHYIAEGFNKLDLVVQVSTKLNRGHLVTGKNALILPCLGRTERDMTGGKDQFVTTENTTLVVAMSHGTLKPASPALMSETAILCGIAHATLGEKGGGRTTVDWRALSEDYDRIRDHIEHVVPGFENYNQRVREPGGFYLPNKPRERVFETKTGRARFLVHEIPKHDLKPGQLMMTSIRSHDQFNTTIYGQVDRYRGISGGRHIVFMNTYDIEELGLTPHGYADLESNYDNVIRTVRQYQVIPYEIPRKCCATYYPENNPLVPLKHTALKSNQPASKSVVIRLTPCAAPVMT